jgi:ribonuclease G
VTKEPISTKGCRVTAQISLPGRFLVYMPFASKVGVSRKIESREERAKLREMVGRLLPPDSGGMIVRTVAEGVTEDNFQREVDSLLNLWKKINRKKTFVRKAPALLQRETSLTRGIIRDLFSWKVDALQVDSKELHHEIEQYLQQVDPELMQRVHLYGESTPLFDKYDIESEIRDLFKARCELQAGGSIIIQPTEALTSIDVNTGRYTGKEGPRKRPSCAPTSRHRGRSRGRSASGTSAASSSATSSTWRRAPTGTGYCRNCEPTWAGTARAPKRWPCRSWAWSK